MPANLVYGQFTDGRMIYIVEAENGVKCNCICSACKEKLIAKNNPRNTNAPHFAHLSGFQCAGALELMLHKLAKQIVCDHRRILLPDGSVFIYQSAEPESVIDEYRADVLLKSDSGNLFVEIVVTNDLSDKKELYFKYALSRTLVIDLKSVERLTEYAAIVNIIIDEREGKRLITPAPKSPVNSSQSDGCLPVLLFNGLIWLLYSVFTFGRKDK